MGRVEVGHHVMSGGVWLMMGVAPRVTSPAEGTGTQCSGILTQNRQRRRGRRQEALTTMAVSLVRDMQLNGLHPLIHLEVRVRHELVPNAWAKDLKRLLLSGNSLDGHHIADVNETLGTFALGCSLLILVDLQRHLYPCSSCPSHSCPSAANQFPLQNVPSLPVLYSEMKSIHVQKVGLLLTITGS